MSDDFDVKCRTTNPSSTSSFAACSVVVERLASRVVLPAVVLDRDPGLRVAEVDAVAPAADLDGVLHRRSGKPGSHQQIGDAPLGVALARVVTRASMFEDLAHHGASATAASFQEIGDRGDVLESHELPPQCLVDCALDHPRSSHDRSQVAERSRDGGDGDARDPVDVRSRRRHSSRGSGPPADGDGRAPKYVISRSVGAKPSSSYRAAADRMEASSLRPGREARREQLLLPALGSPCHPIDASAASARAGGSGASDPVRTATSRRAPGPRVTQPVLVPADCGERRWPSSEGRPIPAVVTPLRASRGSTVVCAREP